MALGGDPHYGPQFQLEGSMKELLKFGFGQFKHRIITESQTAQAPDDGGPWFAILSLKDGSGVVAAEESRIRTDEWNEDTVLNAGQMLGGCFWGVTVSMEGVLVLFEGPYWIWS